MNKLFVTTALFFGLVTLSNAQESKQTNGKTIESTKRSKTKVEKPAASKPAAKKQASKKLEFVSKDRLQQR